MRKSSAEMTIALFIRWLLWHFVFLDKIMADKTLMETPRERREVMEAFILRVVALWETFVVDLLVGCLNKDATQYASYMRLKLPKHLSRNECTAMLIGLSYVDFHGVSDIQKIAKTFSWPRTTPSSPSRRSQPFGSTSV